MSTLAQHPQASVYRIEISGWDENDDFFVEKTNLEWSDEEGKRVRTSHTLHEGAIIFVRLMHLSLMGNTYPLAYKVEPLVLGPSAGTNDFRLIQLHPRPRG